MTLLTVDWASGTSAIVAILALIVTGLYTFFTYLLFKDNQNIVAKNNKLVEFQIYKEIAKQLSTREVRETLKKCYNNSSDVFDKEHICYDLLNPIEDLAKFSEDKLISIQTINTGFGYMILKICNNEKILTIMKDERKDHAPLYDGVIKMYNELYNACSEEERKGFKSKLDLS